MPVKLTQKYLRSRLHYNENTGIFRWRDSLAGKKAGSSKGCSYERISINGIRYLSHRLAWFYVYGLWPITLLDHKDGNGLNNKISNLRLSSDSLNQKNAKKSSLNKSGVTGVFWWKRDSLWQATIQSEGNKHFLGRFNDFFEACCVRKSAEISFGFDPNHGRTV